MATYSVTAMVKPSLDELRVFANHHLHRGAERVFVYHDGPLDDLRAAGLDVEAWAGQGVEVIAIDAGFLARNGAPADADFARRREVCHADAVRRCDSSWLFICDEDEFLGGGDVSRALDTVPDDLDSVFLHMGEAVWAPGDDLSRPFGSRHLRMSIGNARTARIIARLVYGRHAPLFRHGMLGHNLSKQFVRVAAEFDHIDTHRCVRNGEVVSRSAFLVSPEMAGIILMHFDAIGFERWQRKFLSRRIDPSINAAVESPRLRQEALTVEAVNRGEAAARRLFEELYGLSGWQARLLSRLGKLRRIDDPTAVPQMV